MAPTSDPSASPWRRPVILAVRFLLAGICLLLVIQSSAFDFRALLSGLVDPAVVLPAVGLILAGTAFGIFRQWFLLWRMGIGVSPMTVVNASLVSILLGVATVGLAAEPVKLFYFARQGGSTADCLVAIVADRVFALISLALTWAFAGMFLAVRFQGSDLAGAALSVLALIAMAVAAGLGLMLAGRISRNMGSMPKWIVSVLSMLNTGRALFSRPGVVVTALVLSIFNLGLSFLGLYVFTGALTADLGVTAGAVMVAAVPATLTTKIPLPLGAIGVGEAAYAATLALLIGHQVIGAASAFLAYRAWGMALALLGLPSLLMVGLPPRPEER